MTQKFWYGFKALLISGISLYLFIINKIGYFINPQYYIWLLISSGLVFFSSVVYFIYFSTDKHRGKKASISEYIFGILLIIIFLSLFVVPLKPLGSESASFARRINVKKEVQASEFVAKSSSAINSLSVIDWVNLLSNTTNPNQYNGQKITIRGFVSKIDGQTFDFGMYQVSCCVVDGQLYTIPVTTESEVPKLDSWANITGSLQITGQKPNVTYTLKATEINAIETPPDPYKGK